MASRTRYVTGLSVHKGEGDKLQPGYHVIRLVEDEDGQRIANPVFLITDMTTQQARELWEQLGAVLNPNVPEGEKPWLAQS